MSRVLQSSEIEDFYGVLYELVHPMLASAQCVKCIIQDGSNIFTTDVENLLCSLDIEHPAGKLMIQALQSHKYTFGTGTKTLLFMIASLAKAVTYLNKLGIPSEESLHVIHETFADLSKEMEEISIMIQECRHSSEVVNCHEAIPKHFTVYENDIGRCNPDLNTVFNVDQGSCEVNYHYFEKEISPSECKKTGDKEFTNNLSDNRMKEPVNTPVLITSNPVYLKMSNLQDMSRDSDDIAWFFDSISPYSTCTAETKYTRTVDHVSQDVLDLSSSCPDCLLCSKSQACFGHCFKTPKSDNDLLIMEINNSSGNKLKDSSVPELGSINCNSKHIELLTHAGISSFKDSDQHNSDFEDCFDETDKQQVLEVIKPIPDVNICNINFAQCLSARVSESTSVEKMSSLLSGIENYSLIDLAFNEDFTPLPSTNQKKKNTDVSDEFSTCFNDISDSSITFDNSLIISSNSCEHPSEQGTSRILTQHTHRNLSEGRIHSVIRNVESDLEDFSTEIVSSGNKHIASLTNTDTFKITADSKLCNFKEQGSNMNKNSKDKIGEVLLEQLLLQKKSQFRSSLADKIKASSRHFNNSSESNLCVNSIPQEDKNFKQCSPNVNNVNLFLPCSILTSNISSTDLSKEKLCGNKESLSALVQNDPVSTSALSDLNFESSEMIDNLQGNACNVTEAAYLRGSACCNPIETSGEAETVCSILNLHEITDCVQNCYGDIADTANDIVQNQMKNKKKETRFNIHLVDCLPLPSLMSSVSVVQGLAIPCDVHTLERLNITGRPLLTLLISADLTPNFHHQGYKPTLSKRTFISKPHTAYQESDEQQWCVSVFDIITQLNVKLILVKGKASSILADMCEGADVLLLTNIKHHTLSVLSHLHKVDIMTYITLATEADLCILHLQPLSTTWMDRLEKTQQNTVQNFAVVSNASDVQTALLHCSSTMSAQILEERLWKCLHSIANSYVDAKVLPGGGHTEFLCADRVRCKSESALANQSYVKSVILDAIADTFHDYYRTVMLNTLHEMRYHMKQNRDVDLNPISASPHGKNLTIPSPKFSSKRNLLPYRSMLISDPEKDIEGAMFVSGSECLQISLRKEVSDYPAKDTSLSVLTNYTKQALSASTPEVPSKTTLPHNPNVFHSEFGSSHHSFDNHVYDNFKSKISAWMAAVDVVSILQSLGSLVISGVDDTDIKKDMTIL